MDYEIQNYHYVTAYHVRKYESIIVMVISKYGSILGMVLQMEATTIVQGSSTMWWGVGVWKAVWNDHVHIQSQGLDSLRIITKPNIQ